MAVIISKSGARIMTGAGRHEDRKRKGGRRMNTRGARDRQRINESKDAYR